MNLENSKIRKNLLLSLIAISILPFIWLFLFDQTFSNNIYKLANISGFVGAVFLIWQFILGVRGFSKRLTWDYDWVIKIHTFLGINGALFVLSHPILETMVYNEDIRFIFAPDFSTSFNTFVTFGKFSFLLFLFIWFSSGLLRKALKYRVWLYIHYLSYPMLFFLLLHPFQIGTLIQSNVFVYWYWIGLCVLSIIIFVIKLLDVFNLSFKKYQLTEINHFPGDIFTLTYEPFKKSKIKLFPGQYFYIKNKFISEAHPFSVFEFNEETGKIIFGIKKLGKFSEELSKSKVGEIHYLDGAFGEFTFEGHNEEPKIFLAGGIGITPFYENIKQFGNEDTYLFFANRNIDQALYRDNFKKILGKNYFDFVLEDLGSKSNVFCELISSKRIREIMSNEDLSNFKFFICGSPGFTKTMINCVLELGVKKSSIYIEEFEY